MHGAGQDEHWKVLWQTMVLWNEMLEAYSKYKMAAKIRNEEIMKRTIIKRTTVLGLCKEI